MRKLFVFGYLFLAGVNILAQCPDIDFSISSSTVCLEENIFVTNTSTSSDEYSWNFCEGGLDAAAGTGTEWTTFSGFSRVYKSATVLSASNYYTFFTGLLSDNIGRLDHNGNLEAIPSAVLLSDADSEIIRPLGIDIIEVSGSWYGFVTLNTSGDLIRMSFGTDITNTSPGIEVLSFTELANINPVRDVRVVEDGGDYKLLAVGGSSNADLVILDFGTDITETSPTISSFTVTSSNSLIGIDVIETCDGWYGLLAGFSSSVHKIDFGTTISDSPNSQEQISGVSDGLGVEVIFDRGSYYGIVSATNDLYRMDFGSSMSSTPTPESLGTAGVISDMQAYSMISDSGEWTLAGLNSNAEEYVTVPFLQDCNGASLNSSTELTPTGLSYNVAGTYTIYLTGNLNGVESTVTESVTVTNDSAPTISFEIDNNQCTDVSNTFTANPSTGLTYTWDFNGEGAGTAGEETFQFPTAGEKTITLSVTDGTCTNEATDQLTVYDPPAAADFDFSVAFQCTNNEITFENLTVETGLEDVIGYSWDFNGEGSSSDKDPTFTFTTSGTKTVSLEAFIPGCTTMVYSEDIMISDGPVSSYSYSGNCGLNETITFTNESSGANITGYSWDFGDGGSTSTLESPTFIYTSAADYTVSLTVTNGSGCSTIYSEVITVTDDPRASFTSSSAEQGSEVTFTGVDNSPPGDAVTSWSWDFDGLGSSTDQSPVFVFTAAGDFEVSLMVGTSQGCTETITETITVSEATCPVIGFSTESSVCLEESLTLNNTSSLSDSYEWNFCESGLDAAVGTGIEWTTFSEFSRAYKSVTIPSASNYYTFVSGLTSSNIVRLDHGDNVAAIPTAVPLTDAGGDISSPLGIDIIEVSGSWYGFVTLNTSGDLIRMSFGTDITNTSPGIEVLSFTELANINPVRDVRVVEDGGDYKLLAVGGSSNADLVILDFGTDITETSPTISSFTVTSSNSLIGIDVIETCDGWYGLLAGFSSSVHKIDFGTTISDSPNSQEQISGVSDGLGVEVIFDRGSYYGMVSATNDLYRMDFGSSMSSTPTPESLGTAGVISDMQAYSMISDSGEWTLAGLNSNAEEYVTVPFLQDCNGASLNSSTELTPTGLSYNVAGTYTIYLTGNLNGVESTVTESVTVTNDSAPTISFEIDNNQCTDVSNTFTANPSTGLTYTWDFNGEGAGTAGEETFQFPTAGEKTITLSVTDGTCTNEATDQLTVYDPPTAADFDFSVAFQCTNNEITFENLTVETGLEDVIGYSWDFNGEGSSSDKDPTFTFTTSGTKTVSLEAFIPGCTTMVYSEDIMISDGPVSSYSYSGNCGLNETITFTNESSGANITGYSWDFGDGGSTSTLESPTFIYTSAADYTVSLTVTNGSGCSTIYSEVITVTDDPRASFTSSSAEQGSEVTFTGVDNSPPGDAVTSWSWDFDGLGSSTDQSPVFVFTAAGDFEVSLMVGTSQGCTETITETITVSEATCPVIGFSTESSVCLEESLTLNNTSSLSDSYEWNFCESGLDAAVGTGIEWTTFSEFSRAYKSVTIPSASNYYTFVSGLTSSNIVRLDHGDNVAAIPTAVPLTDAGGDISSPLGIDIIEVSGSWYGFVTLNTSGDLIRMSFGTDITNTSPGIEVLSFTELANIDPVRDVKVVEDGGDYKLLAVGGSSNADLVILDFGTDITETSPTISSFTVTSSNTLIGIDVIETCDGWYGLLAGFSSSVHKIDFGTTISDSPNSQEQISGVSDGLGVEVIFDRGSYYGMVSATNDLYRMDFGSSMSSTPTPESLGTAGVISDMQAYSMISNSGEWTLAGLNSNAEEYVTVPFLQDCSGASLNSSTELTPTGLSYNVAGTYTIYLTGNLNGVESTVTESVTVTNDSAPTISFEIDNNQCTDVSNTFTANPSTGLTYTWDFNGEGAGTAGEETFQFPTAGEKTITLSVTDGTCTNEATDQLTVYDPPTAADFDFSVAFQCTNNEITFENLTVETGLEDVIGYSWDFNGEGSSSDKDPTFTFTTSGTKTVSLEAFIPGCTTMVYSEDIMISDGPVSSYSYSGNCGLNETITFTNESGGANITGYSWDFGDGGSTSTLESPTFIYTSAADYTVSLTVTNGSGCSTIYSEVITVTDDPRASFTSSSAEQGSEVTFTGVDNSPPGDAVTSWSWDFDGLGSSTDQSPVFVFTAAGDFEVSLMVGTSQGCTETITETITVSEATCPVIGFSTESSVCLEESLTLNNTSSLSDSYEWNFCESGLDAAVGTGIEWTTFSEFSRAYKSVTIPSASNYYTFVSGLTSSNIVRLDHGDNVAAIPTAVPLTDAGGDISSPLGIDIIEVSGSWYGFVTLNTSGDLIRMSFGTDITNTSPGIEVLSFTELANIDPVRDVKVVEDGGDYKLLAVGGSSNADLVILDFGTDITETSPTISSFTVTSSNTLIGIDVIETCDGWYGLLAGFSSSVHKIDFGTTISDSPNSQEQISGVSDGLGVEVIFDRGSYYGMVSATNDLYRMDFGSSMSSTPTPESLGTAGVISDMQAYSMISNSGEWTLAGLNSNAEEYVTVPFSQDCNGASLNSSTEITPTGLSYNVAGTYTIYLTGNLNGIESTVTESVTITSDSAPSIDFTINDSRCIDNSNTFTANPSTGLTYSWDFNGDGSGTTSEETFQFTSAGEKTITLSVDDGTCTNTIQETLTIYEVPPVPVFDISGNVCESTSLSITNTTEDTGWGDAISYIWTFDGDSSITADQPDFAFADSGTRSVSVISSIPGCTSEAASEEVVVNDLPNTDYSVSPTCDQEVTNFTNLATGATSYSWDFGDGFTSTQPSPTHLYSAPGDYMIEMVAINSVGCADTLTQEFSVDYLPVAGFRAQLPCEGLINLTDTSSVAASDIITWSYSVESIEQLFSDQNPELTLNEPGAYEVTQEVVSAQGCRSSVTQSISVQDAADPNMQVDVACFGDSFHFTDISSVSSNNRVISRIWDFEGQSIEVEDTSTVEIDHAFSAPGTYQVSLTLTTQNLCTSTISRTVEVLERPTLVFDVPQICQNDFASFTDLSQSDSDGITSRQWILNDGLIGNGTTVSHKFTVDGINEISLVTTTQQGCLDTLTRFVDVLPAPQASFEASDEFGVEGTAFSFLNTSTGSATYQWLVDGSSVATTNNFDTIFNVGGNREVELIAFSDFECSDTTSLDVLVRAPEIDVALTGMRLVPDDQNPEFSIIQVSVENRSNLPVDDLRFVVEIDDQLPIQNTENLFVPIGESRTIVLGVSAPIQASYICVEVVSTYDSEDINAQDNNQCINIEPQPVFPPVYPNPVRDEVSVDAVLPSEGDITISLLDISGKVELQDTYTDMNEGLQTFTLELSPFEPGMYFIKIEYGSFTEIKRIVKQ